MFERQNDIYPILSLSRTPKSGSFFSLIVGVTTDEQEEELLLPCV